VHPDLDVVMQYASKLVILLAKILMCISIHRTDKRMFLYSLLIQYRVLGEMHSVFLFLVSSNSRIQSIFRLYKKFEKTASRL